MLKRERGEREREKQIERGRERETDREREREGNEKGARRWVRVGPHPHKDATIWLMNRRSCNASNKFGSLMLDH